MAFDVAVLEFVNGFVGRSWTLDTTMVILVENSLIKGGLLVAGLWWFWGSGHDAARADVRHKVIATMVGALAGLIVARTLAVMLPFRHRPLHALRFAVPQGLTRDYLSGWSSFPSDHATVLFGVATGLVLLDRRWWPALAWTTFVVALPRVYLGLHYPTDIFAGAFVGAISVVAAVRLRAWCVAPAVAWFSRRPRISYAVLFVVSLLIATMFESLRTIAELGSGVVRALLARH